MNHYEYICDTPPRPGARDGRTDIVQTYVKSKK